MMGVDGIDKTDIFDEYFDDDEPKQTNYEKIKSMNIDEMAEFISKLEYYEIGRSCPDNTGEGDCLAPFCAYGIKQWLLAESEG